MKPWTVAWSSLAKWRSLRVVAALMLVISYMVGMSQTGLAASSTVVISEFRVRGPSGGNDEFIEIYNLSASPVNIGGWLLRASNNAGTVSTRATISETSP